MTNRPITVLVGTTLLAAALLAGCKQSSTSPTTNATTNAPVNRPAPIVPTTSTDPDAPQTVTFNTDKGVTIVGDLYLPDKKSSPAILCLHQWSANRGTYQAFAKAMRAAGFVVLAIDGPGWGDSTQGTDGKVEPDWHLSDAIDAAIDQLESQPTVDALRIGIVGASYGASNALIYAADNPERVRSVALLSAGLNYNNDLPTEPALKKYGDRPLLLMAARDDQNGVESEKLAATAKNPKYELKMYEQGGHGTAMFDDKVGGISFVRDFFVKTLTGPIAVRGTGTESVEGGEGGGTAPDKPEDETTPKEPKGKKP